MPFAKTPGRRAAACARRRLLFASAALLFTFAGQAVTEARQTSPGSLIVTASGARLREQPDAGSAEVARLLLGSVVGAQERTPSKSKVGASEDFWYLVSAPNGARGWVFGGLVAPFDAARREEIYRSLATERLARTDSNFSELSELVRFLARAVKEVTRREARAEMELARLTALARSLAAFSIENQEQAPYKAWTTEHDAEINYSEPAGQWYVRSDLYWNLQAKYKDLPVAERAAWQGAQTPIPGECEGF
ncbi:MAG TPA: SH3 domain-containing protein, partial [Pyrinomonadaceae bacterium]|nr:SH3 domain-containing protein [Pyrinomonadaceae bacterium]